MVLSSCGVTRDEVQEGRQRERRIDDTGMVQYGVKQDDARDEGVWQMRRSV